MTTYNKSGVNYLWLAWSILQLPIMLFVDGLDFYPDALYKPAGSPLHFFHGVKQDYIAELNDPIVQWTPETASGHDSWMGLFVYFELAFALPVMLFTIYRLGIKRTGTSGAHELLLMIYGFEAAFTTSVAMHDVLYWDNTVYTAAQKNKLLFQMYIPWLIVPSFICLNMASRILARIKVADAALAAKKGQ
ncbi:transmembrane protein 6/97 [Cercophora newfieldiana]|uniref:Efficient mitochondria targeting-associated protein 19 n=1 Tax=Cercophora newfieldiana TaxID=92897 RepID=A0AA40CNF0_9PEZI|nr:transmembrane protein 6/97 [Cercophora newfieldiana]